MEKTKKNMELSHINVSEYLVRFLKEKDIHTVFELQGGMITFLLDALYRSGDFNIVNIHHEQAAAFAADAFARVSGKPGVALATSGPGATNLITGIGSCYFDSVPAIFITGQVNINEQKGNKSTRQLGFQETDIVDITKPITKKTYAIKSAKEFPKALEEAYSTSVSGRPGPVLIDIPMNVQLEEIYEKDFACASSSILLDSKKDAIAKFFNEFKNVLSKSQRPLVLVGRGVRAAGATDKFIKFIAKYNLPVVYSLLGIDNIPFGNPNRIGLIGTYGNRWANYALGNCDLLLVLGSRLDIRQTGADVKSFSQNKKIFRVDCDEAELHIRFSEYLVLQTDVLPFIEYALTQDVKFNSKSLGKWIDKISKKKQQMPDTKELQGIKGINPNIFIHQLSQSSKLAKVFIADVGNNQMWTAQSIELKEGQLFLTSGGMGSMGYSLPAAIGASIALKNKPVVLISGDGGFQTNIQELQTVVRNKLPIKMIVLNNHCLGMIRQFQDSYLNSRYIGTVWGYDTPDFVAVAKAYGIDAVSIEKTGEIKKALEWLWSNPEKPMLLNVNIDIHTNVYPKLKFGNPITKMEPELDKNEN
jgi:acetolactate synthase-1/2/3 large subunit